MVADAVNWGAEARASTCLPRSPCAVRPEPLSLMMSAIFSPVGELVVVPLRDSPWNLLRPGRAWAGSECGCWGGGQHLTTSRPMP